MIIQTSMSECSVQQNLNSALCILSVWYAERLIVSAARFSRQPSFGAHCASSRPARAPFCSCVMSPPQLRFAEAPRFPVVPAFTRLALIGILGLALILLTTGSMAAAQSSMEDARSSSDATMPLADSETPRDTARMLPPYDTICAQRTGIQATMILPADATLSVQGRPLVAGDQIAVFSEDGVCAGFITWTGENAALTIWGDDYLTSEIDGLLGGDPMYIRIRTASRGIEHSSRNSHVTLTFREDAPYLTSVPTFAPDGIYVVETLTINSVEHANGAQ